MSNVAEASWVDGGAVIDLSLMKGIQVDLNARTVRAQAGALLGELDRETQAFGMAVPAGIVTHTGLAGLTLGGGIGWIMRKYGLTIDQLLSVNLVTADGELVTANENMNSDLFWGVRGGGGNFGVVTEFEFRPNELGPDVMAGPVYWPIDQAPKVLRFYRDWIADCPDEVMTIVVLRRAPQIPGMPAEIVGQPAVGIAACYAGPVDEGGAVARIGEDETAFNGRQAGHTFNINGNAESAAGFDAEREWARAFWSALEPHHTSVYVNFLMEEGEARIEQAYGPDKYRRLKALKQKYDPTNFFRLNQNIRP